jgi:hypothetical protein
MAELSSVIVHSMQLSICVRKGTPLAQRVIQFPVRNAFAAERSHDALARDTDYRNTQEQAHRIAEQVGSEIARQAERLATGRNAEFEAARNRAIITMRPTSRLTRLRKHLVSMQAKARLFALKPFTRS